MIVLTKGEGRGSGLGSDLNLDLDPWKILWIRKIDADPVDPDLQHWYTKYY